MNSDKHPPSAIRGNALIYVLLALALLGALTMLLADQGSESDDLTYEQNELLVTKMVGYAATAQSVVDQMMMSGTTINNLSYLQPNQPSFDIAPYHNKVFHPDGGGLSLPPADPNIFVLGGTDPEPGWYMGRFSTVGWTPSTAFDILYVAYDIKPELCAAINKKITGNTTIPVTMLDPATERSR